MRWRLTLRDQQRFMFLIAIHSASSYLEEFSSPLRFAAGQALKAQPAGRGGCVPVDG